MNIVYNDTAFHVNFYCFQAEYQTGFYRKAYCCLL